eukprot:gene7557-8394_t
MVRVKRTKSTGVSNSGSSGTSKVTTPSGSKRVEDSASKPTGPRIGRDRPERRRFKPGTVALRQIRYFQSTHHLLIGKASFSRLKEDQLETHAPKYSQL